MTVAASIRKMKEVAPTELSTALAAVLKVVDWGTPGVEADNKRAVALQVKDLNGTNVSEAVILRLTSSGTSTMALVAAGAGTVLEGTGTDDMIIQTSATGLFNLEVADALTETVTVLAGPTGGSPLIDCSESVDLAFA